MKTKQKIISNLVQKMQPDGLLIVGHSESLKGVHDALESVAPTVYRKKTGNGQRQ